MAADTDSITSKRVPVTTGPFMEASGVCLASGTADLPKFIKISADPNADKINMYYDNDRRIEITRMSTGFPFWVIDKSFKNNQFSGSKVVWSELIANAFTQNSFRRWADSVINKEGELEIVIPIIPSYGVFAKIKIYKGEDYNDVYVAGFADKEEVFLESFIAGTWSFQDLVVSYKDWFLGEYRNPAEFSQSYMEPELEVKYANSVDKLPRFVRLWYKASYSQSLTVWEVLPRTNEIPF